MRVACLMMEKDEDDLIEPWIRYHGELFGYNNLFVFDNGSQSGLVHAKIQQYMNLGVNVIYDYATSEDFHNKGKVIGERIRSLDDGLYDFFFPLDADEFVAVEISGLPTCQPADIYSVLSSLKSERKILKVDWCLANVPNLQDCFMKWKYQKVFFPKFTCKSVDHGFHVGEALNTKGAKETCVIYYHFHHRPFPQMLKHSRQKLEQYVEDWSLDSLRHFRGPGWHLTKYFFMSALDYDSYFTPVNKIESNQISTRFKELGLEPTIFKAARIDGEP